MLAALLTVCGQVRADFVNGSFDGPTDTHSLTPPGWTATETPDTVSTAGHPFGFSGFQGIGFHPYGASADGGTFAWVGGFPTPREALSQTLDALEIGTPINISFEFTNLGLYDESGNIATNAFGSQNYNNSGTFQVEIDGVPIATTPAVAPFATPGTHTWSTFSTIFVPTSASHDVTFSAWSTTTNGSGHVGMGIDGASAMVVPEPSSILLLCLAIVCSRVY